jgi:hypothetical protein
MGLTIGLKKKKPMVSEETIVKRKLLSVKKAQTTKDQYPNADAYK